MKDNNEIDLETRLMMAEIGLSVAQKMIQTLSIKLEKLAKENRDR